MHSSCPNIMGHLQTVDGAEHGQGMNCGHPHDIQTW